MFDYVKRMIASIVGRNNHEVNKEPRIIKASEHGIDPKLVSFAAVRTCSILQQRGYKPTLWAALCVICCSGSSPKISMWPLMPLPNR